MSPDQPRRATPTPTDTRAAKPTSLRTRQARMYLAFGSANFSGSVRYGEPCAMSSPAQRSPRSLRCFSSATMASRIFDATAGVVSICSSVVQAPSS